MIGRRLNYGIVLFVLGIVSLLNIFASEEPFEITPDEALTIGVADRFGRTALHTDVIEAQIVEGTWKAPHSGDTAVMADGSERQWETLKPNDEGDFFMQGRRGGYLYFNVDSTQKRIMVLKAKGHSFVYVNGELRMGDIYNNGRVELPILLKKGANDFLFRSGRGGLQWKLVEPKGPVSFNDLDWTLPDVITGETIDTWGAVMISNASEKPLKEHWIRVQLNGFNNTETKAPYIIPLSVRKVGFQIQGTAPQEPGEIEGTLELIAKKDCGEEILGHIDFQLKVVEPGANYRRTFNSCIDGSVQYYAVNPMIPLEGSNHQPALFFSLHGAGVEAINQANAYSHKTWGTLVAPTNRRPYGFDWEDWGRMDALEVLKIAKEQFNIDPDRVYLTGHSMGGHGAWSLGAIFPDQWAAIGPCAGWISFSSYGGGRRSERENEPESGIAEIMRRASIVYDTMSVSRNYADSGIYIHHGAADRTVPVSQAQRMAEHLSVFHHDFRLHEQPGAGHWWDEDDEPGAACVDWAPMFDFFSRRVIPAKDMVRDVTFVTVNPGVSAWSHWIGVISQIEPLKPSEVNLRWDTWKRRFSGTTSNVKCLAFSVDHMTPDGAIEFVLDGTKSVQVLYPTSEKIVYLLHLDDEWRPAGKPSLLMKGPRRYGPFKEAFQHRMQFVYGTQGTEEENAWAFAKARYDAEQFWYRGNGSIDVIPDIEFDPDRDKDRAVIVYGNADTNTAWKHLLTTSPVQIERGKILLGAKVLEGGDLCGLFLQPRPGSDTACVAVIGGTGAKGMRLSDRLLVIRSGTGFPDCLILGPEMLMTNEEVTPGLSGVRAAGFFGDDWSVANGVFEFH